MQFFENKFSVLRVPFTAVKHKTLSDFINSIDIQVTTGEFDKKIREKLSVFINWIQIQITSGKFAKSCQIE